MEQSPASRLMIFTYLQHFTSSANFQTKSHLINECDLNYELAAEQVAALFW